MARASIVIPVYRTQATLERCLRHLASQTELSFELILVESGGAGQSEALLDEILPASTYVGFEDRMLAHEALNMGAAQATGEILVFTDPDAYARRDWLARLLQAQDEFGPVVVGAVGCHRCSWLDTAAHFAKFDKWLPGGDSRDLSEGPTVNFSIRRQLFESVGGFVSGTSHADTDLSWRLRRQGHRIRFAPSAVVDHHHRHSLSSLLRERFERGRGFAAWQSDGCGQGVRYQRLFRILVSVLPFRLANQQLRLASNAWRAGMEGSYLATLPLTSLVLYSWLLGEVVNWLSATEP